MFPTDLRIVFEGRSKVRFWQGTTRIKAKQRFYGEMILIEKESTLSAGDHIFLFRTQLPTDLPPTFDSKYGFINFKVLVLTKKSKINCVSPFTVVSLPIPVNTEEYVGFLWTIFQDSIKCYFQNPLTIMVGDGINVYFPKQSIVRGSAVTVEVKSTEEKKIKTKTITIHLMQYFTYEVSGACSKYQKIKKYTALKVPITTTDDCRDTFQIPRNIQKSLNFDFLEIIRIKYVLKVYVNREKFKFPIVIC